MTLGGLTPSPRRTLYGVFKGMGDLLAAGPSIAAELRQGNDVTLIVFSSLLGFFRLLDFGNDSERLHTITIDARRSPAGILALLRALAAASPDVVLISPHAPLQAASRKVPALFAFARRVFWRRAVLAGAEDEPHARYFDRVVPVDRNLPLEAREWQMYSRVTGVAENEHRPVGFRAHLYAARTQAPLYDLIVHPGAGSDNRKWPVQRYAELIVSLPEDWRIACVGLAADIEPIRTAVGGSRSVHFVSGTLEEAIVALGATHLALTMDSGSMFFANALETPTVALFGPSAPAYVLPDPSCVVPVYRQAAACQPCRRTSCYQPALYCMEAISVATVAEQLLVAAARTSKS